MKKDFEQSADSRKPRPESSYDVFKRLVLMEKKSSAKPKDGPQKMLPVLSQCDNVFCARLMKI